tara:strand:- start:82670 stop:86836 length:4167 start_codon:yes stop_codon:yes gene_type:complete
MPKGLQVAISGAYAMTGAYAQVHKFMDDGSAVFGSGSAAQGVTNKNVTFFETAMEGKVTAYGQVTASVGVSGAVMNATTMYAETYYGDGSNLTGITSVSVNDSTANTAFPLVFHDESNGLLDSQNLEFTPHLGLLTAPKLTVDSITIDGTTIDSSGVLTIDTDGTNALNVGTEAAAKTITVGNAASTKVDINAIALDFDSAAATDILAATTLSAKGATGASFGDDTGTWEFNGSGAVTETGMTSLTVTPSAAITLTAGAASTWSTSAGNLTVDSLAGTLVLDGHTGVDIDASNSGKVSIDGAGGIDIGVAADVAIDIDSSTLDIDASGAVTIDGAGIALAGGANASSFNVATGGANAKDLTFSVTGGGDSSLLLSSAGTGADALSLDVSAGSMVVAPSLADGQTLKLGKNGAVEMVFTPHGTAGNEKFLLTNTAGTAADAIKLDSVAGGITLNSANTTHGVKIGTATSGVPITIGHSTSEVTIADNLTVSGDLTVTGTTTTVDVEVVNTANGVIFEGATADGNETTLKAVDPTATRTVQIANASGFLIPFAAASTTTISATPDEVNYLDIGALGTSEASKVLTANADGDITIAGNSANMVWDKSEDALEFADNASIEIGTGLDMKLYHDGTNSYITNAQGALKIATETSGIAVTIGHGTSEVTIADNLTVTGNLTGSAGSVATFTNVTASGHLSASAVYADTFAVSNLSGAVDGNLVLASDADIAFKIDADGDGTNNYTFQTGETEVAQMDEDGNFWTSGSVSASLGLTASALWLAPTLHHPAVKVTSTAAELNLLDGSTAGTAVASKALVVDGNADLTGMRNLTITGELDAASLDISGNADIDGTLEADAITVDGTALNEYIADTVGAMVGSNTETGVAVTYEDGDNTLDFVLGTTQTTVTSLTNAALVIGRDADNDIDFATDNNIIFRAGGEDQLTLVDGALTPSSNAIVDLGTDALEFKDAYFDGTVEADAYTVAGTALNEYIADTAGAMFSSNTETGLTATYQDGDNTIDLAIAAAQTTITSLMATDIKIGEDDQTKIDFEDADQINLYANNVKLLELTNANSGDAVLNVPTQDKNFTIKGDDGGSAITALDIDMALAGKATFNGEIVAPSLDISGNVDVDGTLEADAITVNSVALEEQVQDWAGAMFTGNTETGGSLTYEDGDGTIDFVIGTSQTTITSLLNDNLVIGRATGNDDITFSDDTIALMTDNTARLTVTTATTTVSNNLTVTGDLTVNGSTTTVSTTNMLVEDKLVELANGQSGTPSGDIGMVFERGDSDNAFMGWDESADEFHLATGTFTGASTGDLTLSSAHLRVASTRLHQYTSDSDLNTLAGLMVNGDLDGMMFFVKTAPTTGAAFNKGITESGKFYFVEGNKAFPSPFLSA